MKVALVDSYSPGYLSRQPSNSFYILQMGQLNQQQSEVEKHCPVPNIVYNLLFHIMNEFLVQILLYSMFITGCAHSHDVSAHVLFIAISYTSNLGKFEDKQTKFKCLMFLAAFNIDPFRLKTKFVSEHYSILEECQ